MTDQTVRPLRVIAAEIARVWKDPYFGALPYISAMGYLGSVDDSYGEDPGSEIVQRFLSNARYWKGDDALRLKNELKVMIGQKPAVARAAKPASTGEPAAVDREQRKLDAAVVKAAVVRHIFCPYSQVVLDMRRAVVVQTGVESRVMTGVVWDTVKDEFFANLSPEQAERVKVYDGRELYTPAGRVR